MALNRRSRSSLPMLRGQKHIAAVWCMRRNLEVLGQHKSKSHWRRTCYTFRWVKTIDCLHMKGKYHLWQADLRRLSLLFSHQVVSNSLWPHGVQHSRLPCPSLFPGVCSNSCPLSQWCHPTISSSVTAFSSWKCWRCHIKQYLHP